MQNTRKNEWLRGIHCVTASEAAGAQPPVADMGPLGLEAGPAPYPLGPVL